jgi:hypothetical protein
MKKNMILKAMMNGTNSQPAPTAPPNNSDPSPIVAKTAMTNRNISLLSFCVLALKHLEQLWRTCEDPMEV